MKSSDPERDTRREGQGKAEQVRELGWESPAATLASYARFSRIAYRVLLAMALLALVATAMSTFNYVRAIRSTSGLALEITDVRIVDDDNPRAVVRFRVTNHAPLPVDVQRYELSLRLDEVQVATSISTYVGTDPSVDRQSYAKATRVGRSLGAGEHLDLELTLYIYSAQMEVVREAGDTGEMHWRVRAVFDVMLPYGDREASITLVAEYRD